MMRSMLSLLLCVIGAAHATLPATGSGALDPGFGNGGLQVQDLDTGYDYGNRIAATADGKYMVFGYSQVGSVLSRVTANGRPDPTFNGSGRRLLRGSGSEYLNIYAGATLADGKILAAGYYYVDNTLNYAYLTRLNADGSADTGWGNGGEVRINSASMPYASLRGVAVAPDGSIVVVGSEATSGDAPYAGLLMRLTPAGQVDPSFGSNGRAPMPAGFAMLNLRSLSIAATGEILVAGYGRQGAATRNEAVVLRFNADGTPDRGFAAAGTYVYSEPGRIEEFHSVAPAPDGGVIAVGNDYAGSESAGLVVKLGPAGLADPGFNGNGVLKLHVAGSPSTMLRGIAVAGGGKFVVAGIQLGPQDFQCALVRLLPNGMPDTGFGSNGVSTAWDQERCIVNDVIVDPDDKIIVAGNYRTVAGNTLDATMVARVLGTEITTTVAEFYNGTLDHYFITADPAEAAAIDSGAAGPGWGRTGQTFKSGGPNRVCRFYGSPGINPATGLRRGPNSHFYTIDSGECGAVKGDAGWHFESYDFNGWPLANGVCPAGTQPVRRLYNGRYAQNDSNHRYVTTDALYTQMTAQGWSGEGTVFCAAQ